MVGDPGIEPGVSRLEGVTVPCHTLRPVAHRAPDHVRCERVITSAHRGRQQENLLRFGSFAIKGETNVKSGGQQ